MRSKRETMKGSKSGKARAGANAKTTRRARRPRRPKQEEFTFPYGHGGWRPGAGRKPAPGRRNVPHRRRKAFDKTNPLHVTLRLRDGLPTLRASKEFNALCEAFDKIRDRDDVRFVEMSAQRDHIHMLVEADDRQSLSRAIQGLCRRIGHALNKLWNRSGPIMADRYHDRELTSPRQVWTVLRYLFNNDVKHGCARPDNCPDPYSSGGWFQGWCEGVKEIFCEGARPMARAREWLLKKGWRVKIGPIPRLAVWTE